MAEPADEARAFLTHALQVSGLKPHALAKKAGVAPTTITRPLNDPEFKFTPKPATLRKIAEAAGLDLPAGLAVAAPSAPILQELPIIGPIQAGAWLALDETVQDEPIFFTAVADRRYPHARQWLREVRGDSMNAKGIVPGPVPGTNRYDLRQHDLVLDRRLGLLVAQRKLSALEEWEQQHG